MNLLILKTDIKTKKGVKIIKPLFNNHPFITNWSIDIEDIDNVLRVETYNDLKETDLIYMLKNRGFYCETLPD
ncbi:MAG: hypothetical protein COA57_02085 [Flavobacteriales bacterium]|nr:MAG: hypothetical protein COA57_02085 [Flavobacteriales bacterium]